MDDPIARARALAEKLSQKVSSSSSSSSSAPQAGANATVLGKRSYRDESQVDSYSKRHKVFVPIDDFPDVNFPGLIFGPGGSTLKQLEAATGTRILLRGRGSQKNAPDDPNDEPMHVLIQADSDAAMEHAISKVNDLLHNPNAQKELKDQQLSTLTNFVSPLQKKEGNPNTFSLSSALYANDDGFHMMAPRVSPEQLREERLAAQRQVREGETQKDIFVEAEKVGLVIGRGGETIKSIQALTGVYIQVHKEAPGSYEPMRKITLKGTEAAIQAGEAEVIKCANGGRVGMDGPSSSSGGGGGGGGNRPGLGYNGGGNEETVQVPGSMIGLVIGRGGESIRAIQDRTGCMIQVQKDDNNPQNLRQVKLIGNPNAIAAARQAIDDIILSSRESGGGSHGSYGPPRDRFGGPPGIDGGAPGHYGGGGGGSWRPGEGGGGFRGGPLTGPGMVTVTVPVPNPVIPSLIGKGGEIIKRLQHVSSARIQISRDEGQDFRNVIVSGRPEHCDTAKREIEQIIAVKSTPGGIVDANSIGAGYGPPGGYGGPRGGYGGYSGPPQHGYGAYNGPPSGPYGGPPQHTAPYGADPYGAPPSGVDPYGGAPPGVSTGPSSAPGSVPPSAPAPVDEVAVPEPPTDPTAFESWWGTLSIPQQTAYYKKYYPEMLSQLPQAQ